MHFFFYDGSAEIFQDLDILRTKANLWANADSPALGHLVRVFLDHIKNHRDPKLWFLNNSFPEPAGRMQLIINYLGYCSLHLLWDEADILDGVKVQEREDMI